MIRVAIVAPTPAMRAGLRALLAAPELAISAEVASLVGSAHVWEDADVLLLADPDLLADADGLAPGRHALVVLADDARVAASVRRLPLSGWAVLTPDASAAELQAALVAAAQGFAVVPSGQVEHAFDAPRVVASVESQGAAEALTARERQVLDLLGQGLTNKQIARVLQISEHTVKFHVSAVFAKLGAASRADAVSKGARRGLITL